MNDNGPLDNVRVFPKWNKQATAAERFRELAAMAEKNPELFERTVIGFMGTKENGDYYVNYTLTNCDGIELLGLIELVKIKVHDRLRQPDA